MTSLTTRLAAGAGMLQRWHQALPTPYQPGPPMGPGMMSRHDWADMQHRCGHAFNDHWLDALMANRSAELALCRDELRTRASTQAKHLAQAMLTDRQAQLTQRWHHTTGHTNDHAGHDEG
jgi:Domain of unknown function (DUF305)